MNTAAEPTQHFSDADFQRVARAAKSILGLHLESSKKALIQARLAKRLRATSVSDVSEYCELIENVRHDERDKFISALTTNVTHFFRERHHFQFLETDVLPEVLKQAQTGRRVRIWSAGCSTGQEAYSIAGTIMSVDPDVWRHDVRVMATDVDANVVSAARSGVYVRDECRFDTPHDAKKVFVSNDPSLTQFEIRPELRKMVSFDRLNLMDPWPRQGPFDVIFCRNVAIYFDRVVQSRLWSRFTEQLKPGGFLIIGHSERIHGPAERVLQNVGITTYRMSAAA